MKINKIRLFIMKNNLLLTIFMLKPTVEIFYDS